MEPGYFRARARTRPRRDTHRVDRILGNDRGNQSRRRARDGARSARTPRRRRASGRASRRSCRRARARRRPVHHHARRRGQTTRRARAPAASEARTVIAGYHWFTDWGRDTMISLEGLTLAHRPPCRGARHPPHVRPSRPRRPHPEPVSRRRARRPVPHGRRHALVLPCDRSLRAAHRRPTLVRELLPTLVDIVAAPSCRHALRHPRRPRDGLLTQGAEGYQLTWMDAKVDDWVVTPRRGKAVEINALWYNALRLLERWLRDERDDEPRRRDRRSRRRRVRSRSTRGSGTRSRGYLFDVVDGEHGDDDACRPNQMLAISLPHPVLDRARWAAGARTPSRAGC